MSLNTAAQSLTERARSTLLMYPDYLIYDELKRREENQWEPIPLELPLYQPYWPEKESDSEDEDSEEGSKRGVVIIDMNDYTEIDL